jgi:uncharacterized membrane protein YkoI
MRTVTVSTRSKQLSALLKQARKENIILRTDDGTEFILAEIDDFNREIELTRQNKKLMKHVEVRARQTTAIPLSKAKAELGLD